MNHTELISEIILAASEQNLALLWKNTSGAGFLRRKKGDTPVFIRFGVGPVGGGGLDIVGLRHDGIFVMIDAKVGKDRLSKAQQDVIKWVRMRGGIAGEARSVEQAMALIKGD